MVLHVLSVPKSALRCDTHNGLLGGVWPPWAGLIRLADKCLYLRLSDS